MKKLISIAVLFVMVAVLATTIVNAEGVTRNTLADELYAIGSKYGLTKENKVEIERYIKEYNVTDKQASEVYAKATQAVSELEAAGITDIKDVTPELKSRLVSLANSAAEVVGAKLTLANGKLDVVGPDGKLFTTLTYKDGKLVYTGNNVNTVLVVSSVAVLALATAFVAKRKMANA